MKVIFLGAVQNVTGSRFLVETAKSRILIDCGLYQERKLRARNWEKFPVNPVSINCVLLTHAHIDHCGYLPKLTREGFTGKIYCTPPTREIARIALLDAAQLQEADAGYKKKRHQREKRHGPYLDKPLYTVYDAEQVLPFFNELSYKEEVRITPDINATFYDAGHILGSSIVELKVNEERGEKRCIFSGDIGRWDRPILCDPTLFEYADYLFMEATYGNRLHEAQEDSFKKLQRIILETEEAGGNVVIPAFAIERAQELLYALGELLRKRRIPPLVVFLDSPMAIDVTEVFKKYADYFDKEAKALLKEGVSLFDSALLKTTRSVEESKAINHIKGTSIIMAGSGMCTGGRIKHHLLNNITRPENTILFVGYQAQGTLGRVILERPQKVRILGQTYSVGARIEKINGFSAHADREELLRWVSGFKKPPEKIFIIHSEKEISGEFASTLREKMKTDVTVPEYLQEYIL